MNNNDYYKAEFEAIFKAITDAVVVTNPQREITHINPAFTEVFGYSLNELVGKTTRIIYADPDSYNQQGEIRYNPKAKNKIPVYENEYRRKDGSTFFGETLGAHVKGEDGTLYGFLGVIRDVTSRIEQQKLLQDSEERFRALHNALPRSC